MKLLCKRLHCAMAVAMATLAVAAQGATTIAVQSGSGGVSSFNTGTAGTQADPWLISETISSLASPLVLSFSNAATDAVGPDSTVGLYTYGKWVTAVVTNNTGIAWSSFDLELQIVVGQPSVNGDGLSFAQGSNLPFTGQPFTVLQRIEDPRDFLNFSGGTVASGTSATFRFAITDNQLHNTIYLSQTPNRVVAVPEPMTVWMLVAGLAALLVIRRRHV